MSDKCNCYNEDGICDFCLATPRADLAAARALAEDRRLAMLRLMSEVDAAREEVEEKERLIAGWNETLNRMGDRCKAAERARDEAVAEVARLRVALGDVIRALPKQMATVRDADAMRPAVAKARRALGRTDGEG